MQFVRNLLLGCAAIVLISVAVNAQNTGAANAIVPRLVNFSSTAINDQGKPIAGSVGVTFSIYNAQQGGGPLWLETQNVQADAKGNYTIQLGATTSEGLPLDLFTSGEARWLGVRINGGEEQPRVLLLSVPYALKAADAQTLGGLPASAFVLAAPSASPPQPPASSAASSSANIGGSGTENYIPLWTDNNGDLGNSILYQLGTGSSAKIGINEKSPLFTLDVNGQELVRGLFEMATQNYATKNKAYDSQPLNFESSAFNSTTGTYTLNHFQWQAEPVGNNTATPGATLNLLYGTDPASPAETGLQLSSKGVFTFASGQTFPGTGTITGITTGSESGLSGGGTSGNLGLSLVSTCATNQVLQWNGSAWACSSAGVGTITGVTAGTDLTGGGTNGGVTLNLDTTKIPQLNTANTFTGNQTVNGNLTATGTVSGASYQIGSNLFAFGSYNNWNAFLGFAGNTSMTGTGNTATGLQALENNSTGYFNTASGFQSLASNTTASGNTAFGSSVLSFNTTGSSNTATGSDALYSNTTANGNSAFGAIALKENTGSFNTASGWAALFYNTIASYNTASGAAALEFNTTGSANTASGAYALDSNNTGNGNTTGSYNTATGYFAGLTTDNSNLTGSNDSFLGSLAALSTGTLSNATAIGANAEVAASNAIVLGGINGVNFATANTNVGIGTTTPAATLHLDLLDNGGSGASDSLLIGNETSRGLGLFDGLSENGLPSVGIRSFGVPLYINDAGMNTVLNGNGGKVGIGTGLNPPQNLLTLAFGGGPAIGDGWTTYSSRRWKTNIKTLPDALSKVEHLRGVSYDLKDSGKHEIGVIAEEVGQVVPEVVSYEKNGKDAAGVDYSRLTALLIEAVKQQQGEVSALRRQLQRRAAKEAALESRVKQLEQHGNKTQLASARLVP